jgi:quinol monooxygenase YgiN
MMIVIGSIVARKDTFETLQRLGLEHVRRSRAEPGCLAHDVHVHSENPLKLVFVEKWQDKAVIAAHFKVKASIDFVIKARELAAEAPAIEVFEAAPAKLG